MAFPCKTKEHKTFSCPIVSQQICSCTLNYVNKTKKECILRSTPKLYSRMECQLFLMALAFGQNSFLCNSYSKNMQVKVFFFSTHICSFSFIAKYFSCSDPCNQKMEVCSCYNVCFMAKDQPLNMMPAASKHSLLAGNSPEKKVRGEK